MSDPAPCLDHHDAGELRRAGPAAPGNYPSP
ncbi:hypothetical protein SFR_3202 [Streptomyces sp. FR-008]|nr:hypothetical protein SFR_3202 [Streptomyces sp. FR-008]